MAVEITRDLIAERLGHVTYDRFLFYVMGPYKSFNLNYVLSEKQRQEIDVKDLPGPLRRLFQRKDEVDAAQALLRRVQGALRVNPGVNAFLAVDVDVDTDEVNRLGVKPRGFPWVNRTLPRDHRLGGLERSGGSRSAGSHSPMPAVAVSEQSVTS